MPLTTESERNLLVVKWHYLRKPSSNTKIDHLRDFDSTRSIIENVAARKSLCSSSQMALTSPFRNMWELGHLVCVCVWTVTGAGARAPGRMCSQFIIYTAYSVLHERIFSLVICTLYTSICISECWVRLDNTFSSQFFYVYIFTAALLLLYCCFTAEYWVRLDNTFSTQFCILYVCMHACMHVYIVINICMCVYIYVLCNIYIE
jgi:hypothetical protein